MLSDRSGVTVSITGTNLNTTTLLSGDWYMKGLENGEYSITVSKSGLEVIPGYNPKFNFRNDTIRGEPFYLFEPNLPTLIHPTTVGVNLNLSRTVVPDTGTNNSEYERIKIAGNFIGIASGKNLPVMIFIGNQDVSLDSFSEMYKPFQDSSIQSELISGRIYSDGRTQGFINQIKNKFPSGSQVFIRAYAANPRGGIFTDPKTGEKRAVGFGPPSNVVSFTMP